MVTTPGHLGTLITVHVSDDLADILTKDTEIELTWATTQFGTYPALERHWAQGVVAQVTNLTARLESPRVVDEELHADRIEAARVERLVHGPVCEHGVLRPDWCESCQREWEGE